ncbi:MAG TPA: TPM domain-containing protein [Methylophilus sp.]
MSHAVAALQAIPALSSPVTDLTQTLTAEQQQALAAKLSAFSREKGSQIAVLIVPTTAPEDIAQYSIRVAEAWQVGRDKQDDGVIMLIAKNDRKMRIEVGYGLEGAIPDLTAKRIISEVMAPYFKQGDFYGGLNASTDQVMRLIQGEQLPAPAKAENGGKSLFELLPIIMVAAIVGGMVLKSMFGTFFGSALSGGLIAALAWIFGATLIAIILAAIAGFIFTLVMGSGGGMGPMAGGLGGGGFGGGGRDIFTGGGGDFGGGGASGDW